MLVRFTPLKISVNISLLNIIIIIFIIIVIIIIIIIIKYCITNVICRAQIKYGQLMTSHVQLKKKQTLKNEGNFSIIKRIFKNRSTCNINVIKQIYALKFVWHLLI